MCHSRRRSMEPSLASRQSDRLQVEVSAAVRVPADCPEPLQRLLTRQFRVLNPAYREAEKYDRRTDDLPAYLYHYSYDADGNLLLPHGAAEIVHRLCCGYGVAVEWVDETHVAPAVSFD